MYEEDDKRDEVFGGELVEKAEEEEYHSITTLSEDKIFTEESVESQEFKADLVQGNSINPVRVDRFKIEKQMPNLRMADNIDLENDGDPMSDESDLEQYKMLNEPIEPKDNPDRKKKVAIQIPKESDEEDDDSPDKISAKEVPLDPSKDPKIDIKTQKQTLGNSLTKETKNIPAFQPNSDRKVRIVKQTIFFQGNAFVIEEEISIDSDEGDSVFTSEDEFVMKEKEVIEGYN